MTYLGISPLAEVVNGSGSPPATALQISGALSFNGQPVYVSTGNILGGAGITLQFSLTNPVVLGNLEDFISWAAGQFDVDITPQEITDAVNKVPVEFLRDALVSVLTATLTLTILNVNIQPKTQTYVQVGATLSFNPPLGPSWFNLTQVGFTFARGQTSASPS